MSHPTRKYPIIPMKEKMEYFIKSKEGQNHIFQLLFTWLSIILHGTRHIPVNNNHTIVQIVPTKHNIMTTTNVIIFPHHYRYNYRIHVSY